MIPLRDDQPTTRFPFVTILLIVANAWVFLGWQEKIGLEESIKLAGFLPVKFTTHAAGGWTHLFTSMFMHGGLMHLIGNMWFLWIFGKNIEDNIGPIRYLLFYLLCGTTATLAYTVLSPHSTVPLVGASGAISGVLGAYLLHHPKAQILTFVPFFFFFRLLEISAWFYLLVWIALQILSEVATVGSPAEKTGGVAYAAHIGGFLAGMVLIVFLEKPYERLN